MSTFDVTFCESVGIDGEGFRQRLQGRGVRDCILVLSPEGISLGLLHKESSNRTFVEDEILGREAALDIDSGRVVYEKGGTVASNPILRRERGCKIHANTDSNGIWGEAQGTPEIGNIKGRFPANLVLMHDSKCEKVGSKKVKSGTAHQDKKVIANKVYQGEWDPHGVSGKAGYASEDGTETVDNWECVEHCPVGLLDGQSGVLKSGKDVNPTVSPTIGFFGQKMSFYSKESNYGDTGGASRFFKQVTSQEELDQYLQSMVRGS